MLDLLSELNTTPKQFFRKVSLKKLCTNLDSKKWSRITIRHQCWKKKHFQFVTLGNFERSKKKFLWVPQLILIIHSFPRKRPQSWKKLTFRKTSTQRVDNTISFVPLFSGHKLLPLFKFNHSKLQPQIMEKFSWSDKHLRISWLLQTYFQE